jgi:hypothetical protein
MYRHLPLCLLIGLLIAFRILGSVLPESQPNFQPLAALFFCGALMKSGWRGFAMPFGIWAVTYPFASGPIGDIAIISTTLLALVVTFLMGKFMEKRSFPVILLGSVAAALVFHLITNGAAWLGDPMYEKSLSGLWQSVWTGPMASKIPSWVFLRNSIAANVLFTAMFVGAQHRFSKPAVSMPNPILAR